MKANRSPEHRLLVEPMPTALSHARHDGFLRERATLEGLDVKPAAFDCWLAAGGERRQRSRVARPSALR